MSQGIGPELRRVYAEQYNDSPYLQAARDIAHAAKQFGDVRMGRSGQLVPSSSADAIMVATPELLMQWRLATGSKASLQQPSSAEGQALSTANEQSVTRGQRSTAGSAGRRSPSSAHMEQRESDEGFLAADNDRHRLDAHAMEHSRLGAVQDSAGEFVTAESSEHYDHEASGRFQAVGSSLASSDYGINRPQSSNGELEQDWNRSEEHDADFGGALALPGMPSWDETPRDAGHAQHAHKSHESGAAPKADGASSLGDEESFALRRRLAMRGGRLSAAPRTAEVSTPRRSTNDFDEDEYFGR